MAEINSPDILSCFSQRHFWVSWFNKNLRLGYGPYNDHEVLEWSDSKDVFLERIRTVRMSTLGAKGLWMLPKNSGMFRNIPIQSSWTLKRLNPGSVFAGNATKIETEADHIGFQTWLSVEDANYTMFTVEACSDAHVALGESPSYTTPNTYEIRLGSSGNKVCVTLLE